MVHIHNGVLLSHEKESLRIMFAVGLSYIAFIMLRYVPSIPAYSILTHIYGI